METRRTRLTLIERVKCKDDHSSWEEFVSVYKGYLYTVIRNMNVSHHDTEEILQDLFLKVWDKLQSFQYAPEKGKFRYWLCTIARNMVINFIRRSESEANRIGQLKELPDGINDKTSPEIEAIADKEWKNYIANLALNNLRKRHSSKEIETFTLFVQGLKISEIAEKLGLAENSVYIYKARVQDLLRREIQFLEEDLG